MSGLMAVYRKELSDHLSSYRFVILFALIAMVSLITSYMAGIHLRENLAGMAKPKFVFLMLFSTPGAMFSLVQFVAFFGPLIGIVLGFDAINRERGNGTLIKLVSQPIYRDAVINGKFLAGATMIAVMLFSIVLVVTGLGLALLGIVPGFEEIGRVLIYMVISILYVAFWQGTAILFSILFRGIATSALASVALWIFFSFFVSLGADVLADSVAPLSDSGEGSQETLVRHARVKETASLLSPMVLYSEAAATLVNPMVNTTRSLVLMGPMEKLSATRFQSPLPLGQSMIVVYPHLVALFGLTMIFFAVSYVSFMLQEIRT